jgi:UDP-glucose 4-epimerase
LSARLINGAGVPDFHAGTSIRAVPDRAAPSLAASRVLVTGASGLIGGHLLRVLDPKTDVIALSRSARADGDGVRWGVCDIERPGALAEIVAAERPDVVIHLAGAVHGDRSLAVVGPTLRANLVATVELLEAAMGAGCRRIVLSGSLLEEPSTGGPQAVPPSPYGASRWAASAYGRMFYAIFDAPVTILRPSYAYGPGQERTKLIPYVITALLAGESPRLSSGEREIDWIYAEDVAHAYIAAATQPGVDGLTLDVGSGIRAPVRDVVKTIVELVGPTGGTPEIGAVPVRRMEQDVVPDVDAAAAALGWRAVTPLDEGLRRTVAWYRDRLS